MLQKVGMKQIYLIEIEEFFFYIKKISYAICTVQTVFKVWSQRNT